MAFPSLKLTCSCGDECGSVMVFTKGDHNSTWAVQSTMPHESSIKLAREQQNQLIEFLKAE